MKLEEESGEKRIEKGGNNAEKKVLVVIDFKNRRKKMGKAKIQKRWRKREDKEYHWLKHSRKGENDK